jgi:hypothetical protein
MRGHTFTLQEEPLKNSTDSSKSVFVWYDPYNGKLGSICWADSTAQSQKSKHVTEPTNSQQHNHHTILVTTISAVLVKPRSNVSLTLPNSRGMLTIVTGENKLKLLSPMSNQIDDWVTALRDIYIQYNAIVEDVIVDDCVEDNDNNLIDVGSLQVLEKPSQSRTPTRPKLMMAFDEPTHEEQNASAVQTPSSISAQREFLSSSVADSEQITRRQQTCGKLCSIM